MKVIDVSEHNGAIDYEKVKADGVEGVVIRAGYGKGNVDKRFTANITGAMKVGLHIGIYWFSYAYNEAMAKNEARYMDEIIQPYRPYLDMPVFFDWEYDSMEFAKKNGVKAGKELITRMTKAFCEEATELGYDAGYYLNLDYAKNYYDENQLKDYKRWFARYVNTAQKDCYLWQSSSKGTVAGISTKVDMDTLWGDLKPLEQLEGELSTIPEKSLEKAHSESQRYSVGQTYTIKVAGLNVRTGAGKNYPLVGYSKLTVNAKKHAVGSALLKDTRVTCNEVKELDEHNIWLRIPSGWICAIDNGKVYVI